MADLQDPQSLDNKQLSSIARNPNHPMHTHAKAEMDRRKVKRKEMGEGAMKRIATTQASKTDRMASTDKKGLETFKKKPTTEADAFGRLGITSPTMKHIDKKLDKVTKRTQTVMNKRPRSTMEEKDPEEYDNEGSMMKSQLRQICSANEKLMSMVKDDDNLPEWVQAKVTKATDYIRSVRDYLESEKMEEKTLTPAELKKREKIAKAIERDNPDMPMDKKMAIATATAKRVAEGAYLKGSIESRADAHEDQADHHERQAEKAHKDGDRLAASTHKAAARAHMKAASYYDNYLSKPKHLRPQAASGGASQAAHAATQKANQYNESVAESKDDDYRKTLGQTKNSDEGIAALKKKHGMSHTKAVATLKRLMGEGKAYGPTGVSYYVPSGHKDEVNPKTGEKYPERQKPGYKNPSEQKVDEISSNKLGDYIRKSAADVSKSRGDVRRQDKRIGGQKMADDKIRKKMGYSSQAKVPAGTNEDTDLTELKKSTLASYIKKASDDRAKNAYDIGKSGKINYKGLKRRQGINRAVNKMANEENIDEVLDTPKAMQSYKDKAKYSKDRAANSAAAKILRGPDADGNRADHSPELKTMAKRDKGLKMADKAAMRKTFKALRTR